MTYNQWLRAATQRLETVEIDTARLDSLVLLEDVTELDRSKLLAEPERELTPAQIEALQKLLSQREQHVPLAYVRGKSEFYGRQFVVSPAVLVPRPESETIIDMLKKLYSGKTGVRVADVGAGSGALGISAYLELSEATVDLLEIDPEALKIAKMNVDLNTTPIRVIQSDLLVQTDEAYDVLLCNLPYVPDEYEVNAAATHEPALALFGGSDGLDVYRKLFEQLQKRQNQPLFILIESFPKQFPALTELAEAAGYRKQAEDDFLQLFGLQNNS